MEKQDREALLDLAKSSPEAVAVHDQKAWVNLFATYGMIEDPVGSTPHIAGVFDSKSESRGRGPIERFFRTFIAPNDIHFDVLHDTVCGNTVCRELTIELALQGRVEAQVPMHLFYEIIEENDALRIQRLAAHWELLPMIKQVLGKGAPGIVAMCVLGWKMMSIMGLKGALGFSRGFLGIGHQGKELAQLFSYELEFKNPLRFQELFDLETAEIHLPADGSPQSPMEFLENFQGTLSISNMLAAGYCVTGAMKLERDGETIRGIALIEFNSKSKKIHRVKLFHES